MSAQRLPPPRPRPPMRYGAIEIVRDGVEYTVSVESDGSVYVQGDVVTDHYETHWPERLDHPWMWGKPLGDVVEGCVDRTHRRHLRATARQRDTEELKRQLASREARRREGEG